MMSMPCTGCLVVLLAIAIAPAIIDTRHGYHSRNRQQYGEEDHADMVEGVDEDAQEIFDHGIPSSLRQPKDKVNAQLVVGHFHFS